MGFNAMMERSHSENPTGMDFSVSVELGQEMGRTDGHLRTKESR